mmetsp:Transcript_76563/g.120712  ORF Transcript_76563/g.120712 Transcript_76563/m.120712 type:complete len:205 (+) Transcript_76563:128-742(+)
MAVVKAATASALSTRSATAPPKSVQPDTTVCVASSVMVVVSVMVTTVVAVVVSVMVMLSFIVVDSVSVMLSPLAMLNSASFRWPSRSQLPGLLMSSNSWSLLPLVEPAYCAVSVRPSITTLTSSLNFRATVPGWASRLILQSAVGLSALPLKTVSAVGATKDEESVSKSAFLRTLPRLAELTSLLAAANLLTWKWLSLGNSSVK